MRWRNRGGSANTYNADLKTITAASTFGRSQSITPLPQAKVYAEFDPSTMPSTAIWNLGISDTGWMAAGAGYSWIGDTRAGGVYSENTPPMNVHVMTFNTYQYTAYSGSNITAGTKICFAVDVPNMLMWVRFGAGNWNNSGSADPATGTGGFSIVTISGSALYWSVGFGGVAGAVIAMNNGETAFTHTPPSGFAGAAETDSRNAMDFVGQSTGTNTATPPTHQAGDVMLLFAYNDASTTLPTVGTGSPTAWTTLNNGAGANTNASVMCGKVCASNAETVGTFTNATSVICQIWRPRTGYTLSFGNANVGNGSSTTISAGALTLASTAGLSNLAVFAGHRSTNTTLETWAGFVGLGEIGGVVDATDEAAAYATDYGQAANWSAATNAVGGTSSGWRTHVVEIRAALTPTSTGNFFLVF